MQKQDLIQELKKGNLNSLRNISSEDKKDEAFMLNVIDVYPQAVSLLPTPMLENHEFIMKVLGKNEQTFKFFDSRIRNNPRYACEVLVKDMSLLSYIGENLKNDKGLAIVLLKTFPEKEILSHLSPALCDDSDFMMKASIVNFRSLKNLSQRLRKDELEVFNLMQSSLGAAIIFFPEYMNEKFIEKLFKNKLYYAFLEIPQVMKTQERIEMIINHAPELVFAIPKPWVKNNENANKLINLANKTDNLKIYKYVLALLKENDDFVKFSSKKINKNGKDVNLFEVIASLMDTEKVELPTLNVFMENKRLKKLEM